MNIEKGNYIDTFVFAEFRGEEIVKDAVNL